MGNMFCYQCQEAAKGTGCTVAGVCGKPANLAIDFDALKFVIKGLAVVANEAAAKGHDISEADTFIMESLFKMITNANFDESFITREIGTGLRIREALKAAAGITSTLDAVNWIPTSEADYLEKGKTTGVLSTENEDIRSAREVILYGLMGMAAYHSHAHKLGYVSQNVYQFIRKALVAMLDDSLELGAYVALIDETGKFGVETMALLDQANTTTFGNPEITEVQLGTRNNPAILVSGHDLADMKMLMDQTQGTGVDVYTHSEMLPTHYYPEFKKYPNLVGNYGNSWWKQKEEFETFNGAILFTTNCIVPPKGTTYEDRVYTTGNAAYPGFKYIPFKEDGTKDFSELIAHAKKLAAPTQIEEGTIVGGFAHNQVIALADKVVAAVKSGAIRKFVVMAGCDGRFKERDYYSEFAKALPNDTIILTAGCAKYRYNKLALGDIGGIPRVLDAGQCNDSYSLAVIALTLKSVFELNDINELPIAYNIAWYEQKAVIVLLALLHLGVKKIHLGPTLPAFLSPNVAQFLIDTFEISGVSTVDADIQKMIG